MTPEEKIHALEKMRRSKAQKAKKGPALITADDIPDVQPSFTVLGYVGKNKGIFQILYERGLYKDKMKGRQTDTAKERLIFLQKSLQFSLQISFLEYNYQGAHCLIGFGHVVWKAFRFLITVTVLNKV